MPLDQKSAPNSDSFWVRRLFNVCLRVFSAPNATNPPRSKWALSQKILFFAKIGIFCMSIADPLTETKTHWMVNLLQLLNQLNFVWLHTKAFTQNSSQWCFRNALPAHFLPQQQYPPVYALFLVLHALVYRCGCQFLSLFHNITNTRN